jgi:hypothetical protein
MIRLEEVVGIGCDGLIGKKRDIQGIHLGPPDKLSECCGLFGCNFLTAKRPENDRELAEKLFVIHDAGRNPPGRRSRKIEERMPIIGTFYKAQMRSIR